MTSGNHGTNLKCIVIAGSVQQLSKEVHGIVMTTEDVTNIKAIAEREDVFDLLGASLGMRILLC